MAEARPLAELANNAVGYTAHISLTPRGNSHVRAPTLRSVLVAALAAFVAVPAAADGPADNQPRQRAAGPAARDRAAG